MLFAEQEEIKRYLIIFIKRLLYLETICGC